MVHYVYVYWKGTYFKNKRLSFHLYFEKSQLPDSIFSSIKWAFESIQVTNLQL